MKTIHNLIVFTNAFSVTYSILETMPQK